MSDQAVGTGLIRGVRPDQQLVKVHRVIERLYNIRNPSKQIYI